MHHAVIISVYAGLSFLTPQPRVVPLYSPTLAEPDTPEEV
jgi:hypothetical protein